jgi:short-subunit dehydrogenase involved in D-alanine esterification of teichoic acids
LGSGQGWGKVRVEGEVQVQVQVQVQVEVEVKVGVRVSQGRVKARSSSQYIQKIMQFLLRLSLCRRCQEEDGNTNAVVATAGGVRTKMAINNRNDTTPTNAELTTSFGAPATVGTGFVGIVKDNDTDTNCFIVVSNGVTFYYHKFTKAL